MRRKPLSPPPRREDGQRARNKGWRACSILSVNGRINLTRRHWFHQPKPNTADDAGQALGQTVTPMDGLLGLGRPAVTKGVRELMCRMNLASTSFDAAAEHLKRIGQVAASTELLRQVVEAQAKEIVQAQQAQMLPAAWKAEDCEVTTPNNEHKTRVYIGSDGVMVPMVTTAEKRKRRKHVVAKRRVRSADSPSLPPLPRVKPGADQPYKEFKLVVHYDQTGLHRHVSITRHNHRVAQALMRRDAAKVGLRRADEKIANVDGADWIRGRLKDAKLNLDAIGLDFYHLAEHVHQTRRDVFGDGSQAGDTWVSEVLHTVKHDGYDAFWTHLIETRRTTRSKHKRDALDRLMHYVAPRREMIRYPDFQARGWQIGSGPTEAACKTIPARLKHSGMRWDPNNAQAIASLAALHQNQQWNAYWAQTN